MRMNPDAPLSAHDLVNNYSEADLANLLYTLGEEKLSRPIAHAIVQARPLHETTALANLVAAIYRRRGVKDKHIHPATRTFQALRMAVNQEIDMLASFLDQVPTLIQPSARVAIITFHSIEDRLVKQAFKRDATACLCPPRQPVCTCEHHPKVKHIGRPIQPSAQEVQANPQARSARLRVVEAIR